MDSEKITASHTLVKGSVIPLLLALLHLTSLGFSLLLAHKDVAAHLDVALNLGFPASKKRHWRERGLSPCAVDDWGAGKTVLANTLSEVGHTGIALSRSRECGHALGLVRVKGRF